jgi:hypothetical protein
MKKLTLLGFFASCFLATICGAQSPLSIDGIWKGIVTETNGTIVNVSLNLKGSSGSFYLEQNPNFRQNPCMGKELPVVVTEVDAKSVRLSVQGNTVLRGCFTQILSLSIDEGMAIGKTSDGRAIALKRIP